MRRRTRIEVVAALLRRIARQRPIMYDADTFFKQDATALSRELARQALRLLLAGKRPRARSKPESEADRKGGMP